MHKLPTTCNLCAWATKHEHQPSIFHPPTSFSLLPLMLSFAMFRKLTLTLIVMYMLVQGGEVQDVLRAVRSRFGTSGIEEKARRPRKDH